MRYLRTNTACRITVGPFLDVTDSVTPEVALTVTGCKLTFVVDDGNVPTLVIDANATASSGNNDMVHVTGDDAGFYDLELTTAQTNYLGRAMLSINDVATHRPVFHEFMIVPAAVYDSMVMGTTGMPALLADRPRTWYVAEAGSSANPGTAALPLDTYANAESAATAGDTIKLLPGTHQLVLVTKPGITVSGCGWTTIVGVIGIAADNITIEHLKVAVEFSADPNSPAISSALGNDGLFINDVWADGGADGIAVTNVIGFRVTNCRIDSNYDIFAANGSQGVIENCYGVTDSSYNPGSGAGNVTTRVLTAHATSATPAITLSNCTFKNTRTTDNHVVGGGNLGINAAGVITLNNVSLEITSTHAAHTGTVIGLAGNATSSKRSRITMNGGQIIVSNAGSGDTYPADASANDTNIELRRVNYGTAVLNPTLGTNSSINTDLVPYSPGTKLATDASGRVDIGNIIGYAPTESGNGRLAAGFTKFFNVATPTGTMDVIPTVTTTGTATVIGSTAQDILDKLDAAFEEGGVFSTESLANAPTGGGLTAPQEAKLDGIVATTDALQAANDQAPTLTEMAQQVATTAIIYDTGQTTAMSGSLAALSGGSGGSDGAGLDDDYTGSHSDGTVGNLYQILAMAIPNASPGTNGGIATGANVDAVTIEGVMALTDLDEERITPEFTWNCISHPTLGIISHEKLTLRIGSPQTFGWHFPLAKNVRILTVDTPTIFSGTGSGVTFGSTGRQSPTAKCRLTGISAGTYDLDVQIVTDGGSTLTARTTLIVTN